MSHKEKTAARQRALKARRKAAGMVRVELWIYPQDLPLALSVQEQSKKRLHLGVDNVTGN